MEANIGANRVQTSNGAADTQMALMDVIARLPPLSVERARAMTELVEEVYQAHSAAANGGQLELRKEIARELQEIIKAQLPEVEVKLHGSSASTFALTASNVNLFLDFPAITENRSDIAKVLNQVLGLLQSNSQLYRDVKEDFGRLPRITFTHTISGLECEVRIMDRLPLVLAALLAAYAGIDARALKLGVVFRYWAKMCRLDMCEEGHHPAFMFLLMVVHFLQQRKPPVLPVLHKPRLLGSQRYKSLEERQPFEDMYVTDTALLTPQWNGSQNTESLGELWYGLFRYYGKDFNTTKHVITVSQITPALKKERKWLPPGLPKDKMVIEDPFLSERNICRGAGVKEVDAYFTSCLVTSLVYFATIHVPLTHSMDVWNNEHHQPSSSVGHGEEGHQPVLRGKEEGVEGFPLNGDDEGIALPCEEEEEEDKEGIPLRTTLAHDEDSGPSEVCIGEEKECHLQESSIPMTTDQLLEVASEQMADLKLKEGSGAQAKPEGSSAQATGEGSSPQAKPDGSGAQATNESTVGVVSGARGAGGTWIDGYFQLVNFTHVRYPVVCSGCRQNGHSLKDCPEEVSLTHKFPCPRDTPKEKHKAVSLIKSAFISFFDSVASDDADVRKRRMMCEDILVDIRPLHPDAELNMFGSSVNGFGTKSSDLDLCLKFKGHDQTKKGDVVERIAEVMKSKPDKYQYVVTVTDTRVPIVRFELVQWAMNCDISLENNLALRNTKLLRTYCCLDRRVRVLGYALKQFAKVCDMADAPSGSLSSYAYILMLLHYLQRTTPPVIPVLQELHLPGSSHESVMLDGWECYFFQVEDENDRNKLLGLLSMSIPDRTIAETNREIHCTRLRSMAAVWADYARNKDSISKLWFGMLRYYAYEFDWIRDVVTIKQSKVLTKFKKWWLSKPMCIEDPFDLDHNLGTPVTFQMRRYILQRFENALRYHFSDVLVNRIDSQTRGPKSYIYMDFVMDPSRLIGQDKAPKIMLCNTCGLRGHKSVDCPDRAKRKDGDRKGNGPATPGTSRGVQGPAVVIQPHVVQVHGQNGPPVLRQDRDVAWRERGVADSSVPVSRQGRRVPSGRGRDVADCGSASPAMQGRPHLPATVQGPLIVHSQSPSDASLPGKSDGTVPTFAAAHNLPLYEHTPPVQLPMGYPPQGERGPYHSPAQQVLPPTRPGVPLLQHPPSGHPRSAVMTVTRVPPGLLTGWPVDDANRSGVPERRVDAQSAGLSGWPGDEANRPGVDERPLDVRSAGLLGDGARSNIQERSLHVRSRGLLGCPGDDDAGPSVQARSVVQPEGPMGTRSDGVPYGRPDVGPGEVSAWPDVTPADVKFDARSAGIDLSSGGGRPQPMQLDLRSGDGRPQPMQQDPRSDDGRPQPMQLDPRSGSGRPQLMQQDPRTDDGRPQPMQLDPRSGDGRPQPMQQDPRSGDGRPQPMQQDPRSDDGRPQPMQQGPRSGSGRPQLMQQGPRSGDGRQSQPMQLDPRSGDGRPQLMQQGPRSGDGRRPQPMQLDPRSGSGRPQLDPRSGSGRPQLDPRSGSGRPQVMQQDLRSGDGRQPQPMQLDPRSGGGRPQPKSAQRKRDKDMDM